MLFDGHSKLIYIQIKYSLTCLQCPTMYAQMDEKTGEAVVISKPIPLPALNVRYRVLDHNTFL